MPPQQQSPSKQRALVTGGAGFFGQCLVKKLVASGLYDVTVFDIRPVSIPGATSLTGDLTNLASVEAALHKQNIVFHVATAAPTGANATNKTLMYNVNVLGTKNIIYACLRNNVSKLIFTSSASVVFDGTDLKNIDESRPYPRRFLDYYSQTKQLAEVAVLQANGTSGLLATIALRPSSIFGEHDPLLVPSLVAKAKEGKSKFMIGSGENINDFTYVENLADAHLLAAEKLSLKSKVAGKAYFITNDEPRGFWDFTGDLLQGLGYPRASKRINATLLYYIAFVMELIAALLRPMYKLSLDLTRFRVLVTSKHRHFSCQAAKRDLGYKPMVSMDEALQRTLTHFAYLKAPDVDVDGKVGVEKNKTTTKRAATKRAARSASKRRSASKKRS